MKPLHFSLIVLGSMIGLNSLVAAPVNATPTPILETTCIWKGNDGTSLKQKCKIVGNSSAGSGTSFRIKWEDGLMTAIRAEPGSSRFRTIESKTKVELQGTYEFSRMGLPRQIYIDGLGTITITYQNPTVSRDYGAFEK